LHVHVITDFVVFRVIVNLRFQRQVAAWFQVLESEGQGKHGIRKVVECPEMQDQIELLWAAKIFGVAKEKIGRDTGELGEKTGYFNMPGKNVYACTGHAIPGRGIKRVISGIATDIEQFSSRKLRQGESALDHAKLAQRIVGKWRQLFALTGRNAVSKINANHPRFPFSQFLAKFVRTQRGWQRQNTVFDIKFHDLG